MPPAMLRAKFTVTSATLLLAACSADRTDFDPSKPESSTTVPETSSSISSEPLGSVSGTAPSNSDGTDEATSPDESDETDDADDESENDDSDEADTDDHDTDDSGAGADDPKDEVDDESSEGDDETSDGESDAPDESDPTTSDESSSSDPTTDESTTDDDTDEPIDPEDEDCSVVGGCEGDTPQCNNKTGKCVACITGDAMCTESGMLDTCTAQGEWEEEMCDDDKPYCIISECLTCDPDDPSTCEEDLCMGKVCTAQDECHVAGVCDPGTGMCSNPSATNGVECDDDNACTQTDACQAGQCVGGNPKACTAADQCHDVGVCNPDTGMCTNPNADENQSCNDNTPCTEEDECTAGVCAGTPKLCDDPPACKATTSCSAGNCNYTQNVTDGSPDAKCPANTGYCLTGACVQCATNAQCSGSTPSCRPLDHTCTCRLPTSGNLLVNPGFDGSFVGWDNFGQCTLSADSESCSASKAATVPSGCQPTQCIPVSAGNYVLGARFKQDTNPGAAYYFQVVYYSDEDCTDEVGGDGSPEGAATANWTTLSKNLNIPAGVNSTMIQIWCNQAQVDQVFFGTSGQF